MAIKIEAQHFAGVTEDFFELLLTDRLFHKGMIAEEKVGGEGAG